uniref:Fanconi anemia group F protein n=1 Tax=Myodes glareolus TaxID=447135 RepID=UPI00202005FC|nr:Fanconi anemia group F protein [Myodes glareolus]
MAEHAKAGPRVDVQSVAPRKARAEAAAMEPLVHHMERFSEVLAVSCGPLVRSWDATTVRRALQWARYLLHVYRRFAGRSRAREALERRIQSWGGPPGLRSFAALEFGDARLRLHELGGAAPAAGRELLETLWARGPREHVLNVAGEALLRDVDPQPAHAADSAGAKETQELLRWLLDSPEVLTAFCRQLSAVRLASLADRHPTLSRAYLGLLTAWATQLHYDLQKGSWVPTQPEDVPWKELCLRLQSLCQAPPPLQEEVLETLRTNKALDGDFEVPGMSIWTDLLLALPGGA